MDFICKRCGATLTAAQVSQQRNYRDDCKGTRHAGPFQAKDPKVRTTVHLNAGRQAVA